MIEKILNILFPKMCLNCGKQGEGYLCSSCFLKSNFKFKIIPVKNKHYNYLIYLGKYKNEIRRKMLDFKFYNKAFINEYFLEFLLKNKNICAFLKNFDLIIPVPMFKTKKLKRGYNQTELLGKNLSKKLELEYLEDVLVKIKENRTQSLVLKNERKQNVKNVFKIENPFYIKNKKIILVDDIYTTGATIDECTKLLKKSGVKEILVLVIAKA